MKITYNDIVIEHQKLIEALNKCEMKLVVATDEFQKLIDEKSEDKTKINAAIKKKSGLKNKKNALEEELKNNNLDLYKKAFDVLEFSDPMEYLIDTYKMMHLGDISIGKVLILAVANTSIKNSKGIQIYLNGDSGKGKTHAARSVYKMVPKYCKIDGSLSAKSLFYNPDMIEGEVIFSDDITMTVDLDNTMKRSTGEFQEDAAHNTLDNKTQKYMKMIIPKRALWILTSVENILSVELSNRFWSFTSDESEEMDKKVIRNIFDSSVIDKNGVSERNERIEICRIIFTIIKKQLFDVNIPFGKKIDWNGSGDRRNPDRFLSLIMGFTMLRYLQRKESEDGVLDATEEDFNDAKAIYEEGKESQMTKLSKAELRLVKYMAKLGHLVSIKEIIADYKRENGNQYDYSTISRLINGDKNKNKPGLLSKVPGMIFEKENNTIKYFVPPYIAFAGDIVSLKMDAATA